MTRSSEKRFFTSNLLRFGDWTPNRTATQKWGDVVLKTGELPTVLPSTQRFSTVSLSVDQANSGETACLSDLDEES